MKRFRGFVVKEFHHIFRDVRTLVILFGIPVIQLLLFGFVVTNEIRDAKIAVFDQSKDYITTRITQKIVSSGYFKIDRKLESASQIEDVFREGNIKMVVMFEAGFARKLEKDGQAGIQVITDASEPNTANILVNYLNSVTLSYMASQQKALQQMQIIPEVRMKYNPELKGVFLFVPGIMAMLLILISALMTSISITREKELGTMEVLLASPLRPFQIISGKVMPYILLSFMNAVLIILISFFVFQIPVHGNLLLLLGECLLYIITALSLGILISTLTSSQQIAMMISLVGLMLPTILLSGFIFPVENMPLILQGLCYLMPPKYFITIIKSIMLKGAGFSYVWKETLILAGMTLFFLFLSIKKFKTRLE
ncbi:MAG: ABC transporter permease [Bacteroidia bacterium]|nr:ABC transporter permease [Bacteroidia bacterium]